MRKCVYYIIVFWIIIVLGLVFRNELILRNAPVVLLKVVPIDPKDILRGDYVSLRYEINTLPENVGADIAKYNYIEKIYVSLSSEPDKTSKISDIHLNPPKGKIFLQGKLYNKRIYYPDIDKYFVKEGEGSEIERKLQNGGLVKVAIDKNGHARIKEIITNR